MISSALIQADDWLALLFRLVLAALIGGLIGLNREWSGKAAGLRTHMLVSLGSALFVMTPLISSGSLHPDAISRAVQGVATGVGFLGAGEIIHLSRSSRRPQTPDRPIVQGLTSAASIWVTAALGMAIACGLWQASLIGTALVLIILSVTKWIERLIPVPDSEDDR